MGGDDGDVVGGGGEVVEGDVLFYGEEEGFFLGVGGGVGVFVDVLGFDGVVFD